MISLLNSGGGGGGFKAEGSHVQVLDSRNDEDTTPPTTMASGLIIFETSLSQNLWPFPGITIFISFSKLFFSVGPA